MLEKNITGTIQNSAHYSEVFYCSPEKKNIFRLGSSLFVEMAWLIAVSVEMDWLSSKTVNVVYML